MNLPNASSHHVQGNWKTIANDYSCLGYYYPARGAYRLIRTCVSSLASGVEFTNENSRCLCWDGYDPKRVLNDGLKRFCDLPQEVEIQHLLVPHHKPFDHDRTHNVVFHGWARSDQTEPFVIGSRLCVRRLNQAMLEEEKNCPEVDMSPFFMYKTKARENGVLHHIMVQEFVATVNATLKRDETAEVKPQTALRYYTPQGEVENRKSKSTTKRKFQTSVKNGKAYNTAVNTNDCARRARYGDEAEREEMETRLQFGNSYSVHGGQPVSPSVADDYSHGEYWSSKARRLGNLPRWVSRYTTHVPIEYPGDLSTTRVEYFENKKDTQKMSALYEAIKGRVLPYMAYNNSAVLPETHRLCFGGVAVESEPSIRSQPEQPRFDPSARYCTLRLPNLLPPILDSAGPNTHRRSVLYDHALHMVITEKDTLFTGNVRYKPTLFPTRTWRETPLQELKLRPGVYRWTPFRLAIEMVQNDVRRVGKFVEGCHECRGLFKSCGDSSTAVKNDHTPHFYLMNCQISSADRSNRREVFETVRDVHRPLNDFDQLVHVWASDHDEFFNCGIGMPFNWWNNVDRHLQPITMCWPQSRRWHPCSLDMDWVDEFKPSVVPRLTRRLELRHQWLGAATKLVVKNPSSFFNRRLISVEMCSGGTRGGGYTLLDETTLEVVGAVLLNLDGNDREVYECRHHRPSGRIDGDDPSENRRTTSYCQALDGEPAVGIHFVPRSYQMALNSYSDLVKHLTSRHDRTTRGDRRSVVEDCFAGGKVKSFTPHDFNLRPKEVVNTDSPLRSTCKIADIKDKSFGALRLYTVTDCDPYDRFWYAKEEGTPRTKLSDVCNE